jgi:hypothetical protein
MTMEHMSQYKHLNKLHNLDLTWSPYLLTLHTCLQLLDVTFFKPFNTTFEKEQDVAIAKNNFLEPNKITLA